MSQSPLEAVRRVIPKFWAKLRPSWAALYRFALFQQPVGPVPTLPDGASIRILEARDAARVMTVHFPAPEQAPTVVHFHGAGVHLGEVVGVGESLRARGLGVLLVEYRGYGCSPGTPTEDGLHLDALAALDALEADGVPPSQIVLLGVSLGSAIATEMAVRRRGSRLVLVTPFTSIPGVANHFIKWFPANYVVRERFDNLAKAPLIDLPALVIHGTRDKVVPFRMGQEVAASLRRSHFVTIEGGGHCDLFDRHAPQVLEAIINHAFAI